ncbi:MAG: Lrp/AsnC family transcriptional regulator [Dongiaceae bacterium]
MAVVLDEFDRRLLEALQRDIRQTGEQPAEIVGLSPAACLRRAQRLRDAGVIERDISVVAPEFTGRSIAHIVEVTLRRDRPDFLDSFRRRMAQAPEITRCHCVTCASDLVLILAVADRKSTKPSRVGTSPTRR